MAAPRIGIFGGTFDPIHRAHIEVADCVRKALALDRMLFVVANRPWQKEGGRSVTPAEDRYAMVAAAIEGREGLEASRIELDRGGPSFTIDTVRELEQKEPGAEIVLVVGSDIVPELGTWHEERELRKGVSLAIVGRPGAPASHPPGWLVVDVPPSPSALSSTDLRRRLEAGEDVDGLVPEGVIRCIRQRGLYATGR